MKKYGICGFLILFVACASTPNKSPSESRHPAAQGDDSWVQEFGQGDRLTLDSLTKFINAGLSAKASTSSFKADRVDSKTKKIVGKCWIDTFMDVNVSILTITDESGKTLFNTHARTNFTESEIYANRILSTPNIQLSHHERFFKPGIIYDSYREFDAKVTFQLNERSFSGKYFAVEPDIFQKSESGTFTCINLEQAK